MSFTHFSPIAKATKEDMFRVKKYRPPGFSSQSSFSFSKWNPAATSCLFASAINWIKTNGEVLDKQG